MILTISIVEASFLCLVQIHWPDLPYFHILYHSLMDGYSLNTEILYKIKNNIIINKLDIKYCIITLFIVSLTGGNGSFGNEP